MMSRGLLRQIQRRLSKMEEKFLAKRFGRLFVLLLAYLFFTPFISQTSYMASLVVQGVLTIMLFFAATAVQRQHNKRSIALGVMGVALLFHWLGVFNLVPYSVEVGLLMFIVFYVILIFAFGKQLLSATYVSKGVIIMSLCLYLIIGLLWGSSYTLLQCIYGGNAFSGALLEHAGTSQLHLFNYFSMVTLTTLGYGDITPQIPEAASLCQMQAIVGQFYTAILVAWLVGMYGKPFEKSQED